MDESTAWISQAVADQAAAERERAVVGRWKVPVWCHAVAKYQQAVEKSIKAIVVALRECGVRGVHPVGYDHRVQNHLRLLRRLPGGGAGRSIQRKLRDFLDTPTRRDIHRLESLAPRAPVPGEPHTRNTEYPFNDAHGRWTYPAAPDLFLVEEVNAFQALTRRVAYNAKNFVSALRHGAAAGGNERRVVRGIDPVQREGSHVRLLGEDPGVPKIRLVGHR